MLIFFDESFRKHVRTGSPLGVLAGVAMTEEAYAAFQRDFFEIVRPYYGTVLRDGQDVHGSNLLTNSTLRTVDEGGYSAHWSLAEDLLHYSRKKRFLVFGVVCYRAEFQAFDCADPTQLDLSFKFLFERIDHVMRHRQPGRYAKLVFDDRGRQTNERNAKAITRFFLRSSLGTSYDSIVKTPFYAISRAHNAGLQLADLVTTVIARRMQGDDRANPLWAIVKDCVPEWKIGEQRVNGLKLIREK